MALLGCGSRPDSELPPAATPRAAAAPSATPAGSVRGLRAGDAVVDVFGRRGGVAVVGGIARLDRRRRVVRVGRAEADAGVGPYGIASDGGNYVYVTDVKLGAVLVFRVRPQLRLARRLALPGGPTEIVYDEQRRRLWTVLTESSELAGLRVSARTTVLDRFPTIRGPRRVVLADDRVVVTNGSERQVLDPRR